MENLKGELKIVKYKEDILIYYIDDETKTTIGAFYRANEKEKAIIARLFDCWNSHDTLTTQRDALLAACEAAETAILDAMHAGNLSRNYANCVIETIKQAISATKDKI